MNSLPSLELDPPEVSGSQECDWLLYRAFGSPHSDQPEISSVDPHEALAVGKVLALLTRVRDRGSRESMERALGESAADLIDEMRHQVAALAMLLEEVCHRIAELAGEAEIPVIFLKGMVLQMTGTIRPGSRVTADVDILVPRDRATVLHQRLIEEGSLPSGLRDSDQHLSVVTHVLGAPIEVHYHLKGIGLEGVGLGRSGPVAGLVATAAECLDLGLVDPAPGFPDHCYVTSEDLTVAHLLVHALAQHGRSPAMYPGFQFMADLQDLGYSPAGGKRISDRSLEWISGEVRAEQVDSAMDLLARLEAGEPASRIVDGSDGAALLLRHLLAGAFDEEYRLSLKLGNQLKTAGGGLRQDWPMRILRALWLTPTQIDILYGKPKSRLGYLGWQLWRPFHLVGKSISSGRAWLKLRRRRR